MSGHGQNRSLPPDYLEAVLDALTALDIGTFQSRKRSTDRADGHAEAAASEMPQRDATISLDCRALRGRWRHVEYATLEWEEKSGWTLNVTEDTNHGFTHVRYDLGLERRAAPAEVALRLAMMLDSP